jgi:prepilin peptidase dependent protein B
MLDVVMCESNFMNPRGVHPKLCTNSRTQRGLSMVELMVGIAIALLVTTAATTLLVGSLRESRKLLLEARLMQELRTSADVITRDLRRAGYWANAADGVVIHAAGNDGNGISVAHAPSNPYAALDMATETGEKGPNSADSVSFQYAQGATSGTAASVKTTVDSNEKFGFRLRKSVIDMQLGAGNWQALTDTQTVRITEFSVTPLLQEISLERFCSHTCAVGDANCTPPRQHVRSLQVVISGQLMSDSRVTRSVRSQVRVRNDQVLGACSDV